MPTFTMNQIIKQYTGKNPVVVKQATPPEHKMVVEIKEPIQAKNLKKCKFNEGVDALIAEINKTFEGWDDLDIFRQLADNIKTKN